MGPVGLIRVNIAYVPLFFDGTTRNKSLIPLQNFDGVQVVLKALGGVVDVEDLAVDFRNFFLGWAKNGDGSRRVERDSTLFEVGFFRFAVFLSV